MSAVVFVSLMCALSAFLLWFLQKARFRRLINQIPGPPGIPILGNAHQMTVGPEWYKQALKWGREFGKPGILKLWLMTNPVVVVTKAETVEVLLNSSKHIDKSDVYDFLHVWLGTGLLTSTGIKWKSRRRMLTPTFHFRILHDFLDVFNQQSRILVAKLQSHVGQGPFNVFQDIALCALDIICDTAMGKHVNAQTTDSEYVRAVYKMCELVENRMRKPLYWNSSLFKLFGPGREHDRCLKILQDFTKEVIEDRRENFDRKRAEAVMGNLSSLGDEDDIIKPKRMRLAFLDMLLYMADDGRALSLEDIQEEVDTFMFEGHDTTAASMNWCTHLIGANNRVQSKVHEELDRVFGNSDRMPTMDDLKELKYLECCIKEALRVYPSVPYYGRTTTEDAQIGSYIVPSGVTVVLFAAAIHRDERWYPNPDVFDPDRFLPENSTNRHPYAYIPFSAGLRNCIGQRFALLEEKTVLSSIFRHFRVKSCQTQEELLPVGELILRPQKGISIELTAR